jgi:hypothetical protein
MTIFSAVLLRRLFSDREITRSQSRRVDLLSGRKSLSSQAGVSMSMRSLSPRQNRGDQAPVLVSFSRRLRFLGKARPKFASKANAQVTRVHSPYHGRNPGGFTGPQIKLLLPPRQEPENQCENSRKSPYFVSPRPCGKLPACIAATDGFAPGLLAPAKDRRGSPSCLKKIAAGVPLKHLGSVLIRSQREFALRICG